MPFVFSSTTIVPLHFPEYPDRPSMACLHVCQMWFLFRYIVYILACNGPEQRMECEGPLVQIIWVSFTNLGENGTYLYVGDKYLRVLHNNSFVFARLLEV